LIGSDVAQAQSSTRDTGATVWADYEMDNGWRQQWIAMHFGNRLDINDAGFLSRNSANYLHWQINRRFTDADRATLPRIGVGAPPPTTTTMVSC